jgi:hypothetical protein
MKLLAPLGDVFPISHPTSVEAFRAHIEDVKPRFQVVSVSVFDPTAQPQS